MFLASAFVASACLAQTSSFVANTSLSTDGYYVLSWDSPEVESQGPEYRLEESSEENFSDTSVIYSGPDRSRVMSGKPNDIYYYRLTLVEPGSPRVGEVVSVEVRHHSIQRASFFFFLGLVVFGSILVTVFIGMRDQHKEGQ